MEGQQPLRIRSFVCGLVAAAALVLPAWRAEAAPEARVVLNSDRLVVGSRWDLDLFVDAVDPLTVKVPVPTLPQNLALVDGPYIRETLWEKTPGKQTKATKVTFTLRTLQPGIVEVGPFDVKVGSVPLSVAPVTVYLLAADEAKRRFPVEVRWIKPDGPFYEGQAIPLILQARNLDTLVQPPDIGMTAPSGALWEKAVGLGEIEINSVGEDRLMNVPWGGWMAIPTRPGTLVIPAFQAPVAGLTRSVPALSLDVLPLPTAAATSRAVGVFSYSIDAKVDSTSPGGVMVVTQEISGRGNFPYLKLPEVTVPGLSLTSRQEGTQYRAGKTGYEGSLVVTWRFTSDQPRDVTAILPGFQAFQPATGMVDTWEPKVATLSLDLPDMQVKAPPSTLPLDWDAVRSVRPWSFHGWRLLWFLPGPLFLAATFLWGRKGKGLLVLLALGLMGAAETSPAGFDRAFQAKGTEAADEWAALLAAHPDEPGFWYNKALACRDAGRTAEAVQAFRMALRTGFQGDLAAKGLVALEQKELLADQFTPWSGWPTNLLFLMVSVGANLIFIFWGLQRLTGASFWLLPMAVLVLATGTTVVIAAGAETARLEPDAVVGLSDCPIRKVPGDLAETWMTLKAGTVVKVQGSSNQWVLVQTGYGLEGWVSGGSLLRLVD
jgi:hypothetical protein